MKIIRKLSQEEFEQRNPSLADALKSDQKDVIYCMTCDGLRLKDHVCVDIIKPN